MTLKLSSSYFGLPRAGIISMCHHALAMLLIISVKIHLSIRKSLQTFMWTAPPPFLGLHMGESEQLFLICPAQPSISIAPTLAYI